MKVLNNVFRTLELEWNTDQLKYPAQLVTNVRHKIKSADSVTALKECFRFDDSLHTWCWMDSSFLFGLPSFSPFFQLKQQRCQLPRLQLCSEKVKSVCGFWGLTWPLWPNPLSLCQYQWSKELACQFWIFSTLSFGCNMYACVRTHTCLLVSLDYATLYIFLTFQMSWNITIDQFYSKNWTQVATSASSQVEGDSDLHISFVFPTSEGKWSEVVIERARGSQPLDSPSSQKPCLMGSQTEHDAIPNLTRSRKG